MIKLNEEQIKKVADVIRRLKGTGNGLDFTSIGYPPLNHPGAIDFFFFTTALNYGFWYGDANGYVEPLIGIFDGKPTKGADLLIRSAGRAFSEDPNKFKPKFLAAISPREFANIFSDDNGPIPFPDFETRFQIARKYGQWVTDRNIVHKRMINIANKNSAPLEYFLTATSMLPGFNADPLRKKNMLLAMALANRPEQFLRISDPENWKPIIDYHVMRVALRLGLVDFDYNNSKRNWTSEHKEQDIRFETYHAIDLLVELSRKSMSFVDEKLWMARQYCPEMEKPDCKKCIFDSVCKKRIELFQPVFRTTAY